MKKFLAITATLLVSMVYAQAQAATEPEELKAKAQELRGRIARYGEVNLASIEELDELNQRFTFLESQRTDLEQSLENLRRTIRKINATTKEKFLSDVTSISRSRR